MWKEELAQSYSNVDELARAGLLLSSEADKLRGLGERFKARVTPYYASLMAADPSCPIRRQALPDLGEEDPTLPDWAREWSLKIYARNEPWHADAIGDLKKLAAPRLTHRYENRALLHLSSMCAVYCRFCFRKEHLNDSERTLYEGNLDPAFEYLAKTPSIRELILTGGDPLSITDSALGRLLERAEAIPHLKTVRIHSRMAVTLPTRLSSELAQILGAPRRLHVSLVSHFNHPREWTALARTGLERMRRSGVSLFNQNVLLAGVNDSVDTLTELYQSLYEDGVTPFYLHHPDWTPGTFQFRVSIEQGQKLVRQLRGRLPGPAVPHYVLDIPQGWGKTPLIDSSVRKLQEWKSKGPLHGALYEVPSPAVRDSSATPHLYLDLFPASID